MRTILQLSIVVIIVLCVVSCSENTQEEAVENPIVTNVTSQTSIELLRIPTDPNWLKKYGNNKESILVFNIIYNAKLLEAHRIKISEMLVKEKDEKRD